MEEKDLIAALDRHDALVLRCATSDVTYDQFEREYDSFFQRWALDGHESGPEEAQLLARYAERIRLHRRIWEEVIVRATSDELARQPDSQRAGFIGPVRAQLLLKAIVADAGLLLRGAG